ncbi:hypothetical protein [Geobacter sp. OR-1]|uniref:hypothetical protein n=1 Tax=Geobacter sp. OR-1 TaxID=1266765 RepID=UPI0005AAB2A8|nr:hypothetical protein [Geobacter sp. OR-1]
MAMHYRSITNLFLHLIFLLLLISFGLDPVAHLLQAVADSGNGKVFTGSGVMCLECEDTGSERVESNDEWSPEYPIPASASSPATDQGIRMLLSAEPEQYLPLIILPIISPPKIVR